MSAPTAKSKRGPTVLMTDSRDSAPRQQQRPSSSLQRQATGARLISVDNILQYASDIPSQQRRGPPATRPVHHSRTPSGRHPLDPKLSGRLIPAHMPTRSSKLSEKLVLLPETDEAADTPTTVDEWLRDTLLRVVDVTETSITFDEPAGRTIGPIAVPAGKKPG